MLEAFEGVVGGADFGEFPMIELGIKEFLWGGWVLEEGFEGVVEGDRVHGGTVAAVAEGFEGHLVDSIGETVF